MAGVKVVEFVGRGAAPFSAMMVADAGAEVIRIDTGADTEPVLRDGGFSAERVRDLQAAGAIPGKASA